MNDIQKKYAQYIDALGGDIPKISEWLGMSVFSIYAKMRKDLAINNCDIFALSALLLEKTGAFPAITNFSIETYTELIKNRLKGNNGDISKQLGISRQTITNKTKGRTKIKKYDIYALQGLINQIQKTEK